MTPVGSFHDPEPRGPLKAGIDPLLNVAEQGRPATRRVKDADPLSPESSTRPAQIDPLGSDPAN